LMSTGGAAPESENGCRKQSAAPPALWNVGYSYPALPQLGSRLATGPPAWDDLS
jgi:hypothetical protein